MPPGSPLPGRRLRAPARGHPSPQVRASGVRGAGGRLVLRPRRPGDHQVAPTAQHRPARGLRDELPEVRPQKPEQARAMLTRELHIVHPKLVVAMGDDTLRFLNELDFPLSDPVEPRLGELQRFTPTIDALVVPTSTRHSTSRRRRPSFGTRSKRSARGGRSCRRTEPRRVRAFLVLSAALAAYFAWHERLPDFSLWWDVAFIGVLVIPAVFATVLLLLPLRRVEGLWIAALVLAVLAIASRHRLAGARVVREARRGDVRRLVFLDVFEAVSWVVARRAASSRGWTRTRSGAGRRTRSSSTTRASSSGSRSRSPSRARRRRTSASRISCSSPLPRRGRPLRVAHPADVAVLMTASFGVTIALAVWLDLGGLPALPASLVRLPRRERRPALAPGPFQLRPRRGRPGLQAGTRPGART